MICPDCKGEERKVLPPTEEYPHVMIVPCPTCQGSRIAYCCEGMELPCDTE